MTRRPITFAELTEYPRPVIPAGLTTAQEDDLLEDMMDQLIAGRLDSEAPTEVEVRTLSERSGSPDEDIVEF